MPKQAQCLPASSIGSGDPNVSKSWRNPGLGEGWAQLWGGVKRLTPTARRFFAAKDGVGRRANDVAVGDQAPGWIGVMASHGRK